MNLSENKIAVSLLRIKAVKLRPSNPFTWTSGWKSPIYCDNRKTLSFPDVRTFIRDSFADTIARSYPNAELIAGVATGAIAHGALVADKMGLPFIYVRSGAKEHGLGNQIEGYYEKGQKTVVIEDLISTGKAVLAPLRRLGTPDAMSLEWQRYSHISFQRHQMPFPRQIANWRHSATILY